VNAVGRRARWPDRSERLPKHLDAEASILGGIILQNDVLERIDTLDVDDFFDHRHKVVFQAIRNLHSESTPIDVVTLEKAIEQTGKLDAVGGIAFLGELAARVPTPDNIVTYAQIVQQASKNRRAIIVLSDAVERALTWPHEPSELIAEVTGELQRIDSHAPQPGALERDPKLTPLLCDFLGDGEPDDNDAEDWRIRDIIPRGEPVLWGGPMKRGKTWGALDLAIAAARGEPWLDKFENTSGESVRVLGLFLEDNKRRLRKRLWELCRSRGITPDDDLLRANLSLTREPIRLPDDARAFVRRARAFGPAIVIVDNLTRVMVGDPNSTRDAAAFTKAWAQICDELEASVLFLHHTKKAGANGTDRQGDPFDQLRGSGDFGAAARNMLVSVPFDLAGEQVSEVRVRGNLDLRRDSFVLGFERKENVLGRWQARLVDRGDVEALRADAGEKRKTEKREKRRAELAAETEMRRQAALDLVRTAGNVSSYTLGLKVGISPNTATSVLKGLAMSGVLVSAGKNRGYTFPEEPK